MVRSDTGRCLAANNLVIAAFRKDRQFLSVAGRVAQVAVGAEVVLAMFVVGHCLLGDMILDLVRLASEADRPLGRVEVNWRLEKHDKG